MNWISKFQLFLFDFDGLLVNTEALHFEAYQTLCARHGFKLNWDFSTYCGAAHFDATSLREALYAHLPGLYAKQPVWEELYAEKKEIYMELLRQGRLQLMPGVERLLRALQEVGIKRCVVTHSPQEQVDYIRQMIPTLNLIPHWVTREDYLHPKPAPDGYEIAIERFAARGDEMIGFEDSLRGLQALKSTRKTLAVLISSFLHPLFDAKTPHFSSFSSIPDNWSP